MEEVQDQVGDHTADIPGDSKELEKIFPHWLEKTLQSMEGRREERGVRREERGERREERGEGRRERGEGRAERREPTGRGGREGKELESRRGEEGRPEQMIPKKTIFFLLFRKQEKPISDGGGWPEPTQRGQQRSLALVAPPTISGFRPGYYFRGKLKKNIRQEKKRGMRNGRREGRWKRGERRREDSLLWLPENFRLPYGLSFPR
jgi:hypothetical protein